MKKMLTLMAAVCFAMTTFAQDTKTETPAQTQQTDKKSTTTTTTTTKTGSHECYKMIDNQLIHCMGEKTEPQKSDVKLKNGTMVTTSGVVVTKDGTKTQLENGQCVSMMGSIGDCEKMHASDDNTHDNMK
jgi:hypothetical protein